MKKNAFPFTILATLAFLLPTARADRSAPSESLSPSDRAGIRAAHEVWRHRFERDEDGSFTARNPGQQWTTRFDGRGFLVEPAGKDWRWGLELGSYGIGEERQPVSGKARVETSEKRLSYRWDGSLEEWFLNDTRGLEQGWTFSDRPTGAEEGKLRLDFSVRGGLGSVVKSDGRSVAFTDSSAASVLNYGGLKAWDAEGRDLPVRFLAGGSPDLLSIEIDERGAAYPVTIDPVAQQARLVADNAEDYDSFGSAVAISGDTVVVGAPFEAGDENSLLNSGAIYVFVRDGAGWTQQAYLKASNAGAHDMFGASVGISGDLIVVGARGEDASAGGKAGNNDEPNSGAAYVFFRSGTVWSQVARLKAADAAAGDNFGYSVAISDGTVVVGAPYRAPLAAGAAYVFAHDGTGWSQTLLTGSDTDMADLFGTSVDIAGDTIVVGSPNAGGSGKVYAFTYDGATWSEEDTLRADDPDLNDNFGASVAISGDTVVVGAPAEDSDLDGAKGSGDDDIGAAYVFVREGASWSQQAFLKAHNAGIRDYFGEAVAISGDTVVVGAYWEDGSATVIDGPDDNDAMTAGAAYVFVRSGTDWTQRNYLKGSNGGIDSAFGRSVAVLGDTIVVGATGDGLTGAVYLFDEAPPSAPNAAPTLTITGKKSIRVKGSKASHLVRGTAADIDGNLRRIEARDMRPKGAKKFRPADGTTKWSYRAPLKRGRNTIQVRAVDAEGARSGISRLTVIRK